MKIMGLYVVFNDEAIINNRSDNYFLVRASSKREAIDKIFENHFDVLYSKEFFKTNNYAPFYKKNFSAISVEDALKHSDVFCIE